MEHWPRFRIVIATANAAAPEFRVPRADIVDPSLQDTEREGGLESARQSAGTVVRPPGAVPARCTCGGTEADSGGAVAEERTFAEGVGEDKCAVLTMEDVVAATDLPPEVIEQRKVSGCLYSWDDGTVWMSSVRVHESVDRAKSYYARFTEDVSADETEPAREQVKDELSEKEGTGEITATEGAAGRAITDAMPARDYTHQHDGSWRT